MMKNSIGCLLVAFFTLNANSQQLYLETGKVISSFDYKNSEGNSLSDLEGTTQNSFGLGARMAVMKSSWNLSLGISSDKYGATCSDQTLGNYSEWEVSYLGVNLGVDYEFFKPHMYNAERDGFSFYLKGVFTTDFFINGKQRLNSQVFDLDGMEEFDKPVYFLKGGAGINYYITRSYVAFVQYLFGRSLLPGNYSGQEQLRYLTHSINIGFSVNLVYKRN